MGKGLEQELRSGVATRTGAGRGAWDRNWDRSWGIAYERSEIEVGRK